ncbi:MAG: sporulation protein YqfD [Lachnospiraceae bacterium]|nr:sporulation protein YqfD [Lachnospiraceae bacterium]
MLSFFRYLKGYVFVYLYGFSPERFLNLCNNHHIKIWKVEPYEQGYQFNIFVSDLFRIKDFLRKTKTKVVIRKKLGLPFLLYRYRKRKIFFLCLALCAFSLFLTTRFLWSFEISGNRTLTKDIYMDFLKNENIFYGTPIHDINTSELEKQLRNQYDYITWASFQVNGTRLVLTVKENSGIISEAGKNTESSCDICASVSGVITKMVTRTGTPLVGVGSIVSSGDILISGLIPVYNDDETIKTIHKTKADGDIVIESNLEYKDEQLFRVNHKLYTGRESRKLILAYKDHEFHIQLPEEYEKYDIMSQNKIISFETYQYVPIYLGYERFMEYTNTEEILNKDMALCRINDRFLDFCKTLNQKGIQIIKKDVKINYKKDRVEVLINLTVRQSDGIMMPISNVTESGE